MQLLLMFRNVEKEFVFSCQMWRHVDSILKHWVTLNFCHYWDLHKTDATCAAVLFSLIDGNETTSRSAQKAGGPGTVADAGNLRRSVWKVREIWSHPRLSHLKWMKLIRNRSVHDDFSAGHKQVPVLTALFCHFLIVVCKHRQRLRSGKSGSRYLWQFYPV